MNLKQIAYSFRVGSATALLAGAVAFAQSPGAPQQPTMPQPQSPASPGMGGATGTPGSNPGAYPGTAPTSQDFAANAFVQNAMQGDIAEVQLGQLAEQKSQSNDVKQFAQKMVNDHGQMNEKWFKPVAQQLGISAPKKPSKKDKKEMAKLEQLSGPAFDQQYITMMVKDHQKDLKDFKDEAQVAQNPNLKQVATQGANLIEQHLQLAEQIAKNHNVPVEVNGKDVSSTKK
jgi:putative membrane protein